MVDPLIEWPRVLAAVLLVAVYGSLCVLRYRAAYGASSLPGERPAAALADAGMAPAWVIYASQTGQAEAMARQTAAALEAGGCPTRVAGLHETWLAQAHTARCLLFVVSTHGEGEAPDHAACFARSQMAMPAALSGVPYAVLALGDRHYARFCGFGRALEQWLVRSGARPLFPRIDVDRLDPQSIAAWLQALGAVAAPPAHEDFGKWCFVERACLNPGSAGEALCRVRLRPAAGALPDWQAGDLADLLLPADGVHPRTYSIANLPADGTLELIVRTRRDTEGRPGLVSGWLNEQAVTGGEIALRVRAHPAFRLEAGTDTPLILIGAGAGLAGLRAHLAARAAALRGAGIAAPPRSAWLFYGERSPQHDRPCGNDITEWLREGVLSRADFAFSRDPVAPRYVQHLLVMQAKGVREWVEAGASMLVCGAASTMATGVDAALRDVFGNDAIEALLAVGRLRRDVF